MEPSLGGNPETNATIQEIQNPSNDDKRSSSRKRKWVLLTMIIAVSVLKLYLDSKSIVTSVSISTSKQTNLKQNQSQIFINNSSLSCLSQRGWSGHWTQDWKYAKRSDYKNDGSYTNWHLAAQNFTPTPSQPFRLATSYRWIDDKCPVHEVDVKEFCNACMKLQITLILILGDSLSIEFSQSLQSLLGFRPKGSHANRFRGRLLPRTMKCPSSSSSSRYEITFLNMRLSPVADWEKLPKNNSKQNKRLSRFINETKNKTAIIANLGPWMKTTAQYEKGFTCFLEWLDHLDDPNNIITFWRPTIPGHLGCRPAGEEEEVSLYDWKHIVPEEPYQNYTEFLRTIDDNNGTTGYRWELFESWNTWTYKKLLHEHYFDDNMINESKEGKIINRVHWLNIFNSSVLRRMDILALVIVCTNICQDQ